MDPHWRGSPSIREGIGEGSYSFERRAFHFKNFARGGPAVDAAHAFAHFFDMGFDRRRADAKLSGDLFRVHMVIDKRQALALAIRQGNGAIPKLRRVFFHRFVV